MDADATSFDLIWPTFAGNEAQANAFATNKVSDANASCFDLIWLTPPTPIPHPLIQFV
jgi:hypothetical protein